MQVKFHMWSVMHRHNFVCHLSRNGVALQTMPHAAAHFQFSILYCRPTLNDTNLLRTLVNLFASDLAMSVSHSGHMYAMMMACTSLSPASHLVEQFGGLSQVSFACNQTFTLRAGSLFESLVFATPPLVCETHEERLFTG